MTAPTNAMSSGSITSFFRPWSKYRFFVPFQGADSHVSAETSFEHSLGGVARYTIHIFVGTILFFIIAGAALALRYISNVLMAKLGMPQALGLALSFAEYAILAVDMLLFLIFMFRATINFMRQLWSDA